MHRSIRGLAGLAAVAMAALVLAGRPALAADDAHTLSLRLDWLPSGYQSPIFLAAEKGWFKKAGIDITIDQGNGSATTVQLVGAGQYDVGFATLSAMAFARGKGMPVISIAGFFRKGDLGLLVPVSSPIKAPADIKGKRLVYTAGSMEAPFLDAFFTKAGLTRDQVQLVQVDASAKVPTYLNEGVDGVFTSTAFTLALVEAKKPTRSVLFADFDLNLPGFGVLTTEGMLKRPRPTQGFAAVPLHAGVAEAADRRAGGIGLDGGDRGHGAGQDDRSGLEGEGLLHQRLPGPGSDQVDRQRQLSH